MFRMTFLRDNSSSFVVFFVLREQVTSWKINLLKSSNNNLSHHHTDITKHAITMWMDEILARMNDSQDATTMKKSVAASGFGIREMMINCVCRLFHEFSLLNYESCCPLWGVGEVDVWKFVYILDLGQKFENRINFLIQNLSISELTSFVLVIFNFLWTKIMKRTNKNSDDRRWWWAKNKTLSPQI